MTAARQLTLHTAQVQATLGEEEEAQRVVLLWQRQAHATVPRGGGGLVGLDHQQQVPGRHLLATPRADLLNHARDRRLHGDLHLHGLEHRHGSARLDAIARLDVQRHHHRRRTGANAPGGLPLEAMR
ncbi:MAG: hypothetical protein JRG85_16540, partial [Deltaproteobacteria bacterium]|nr:hypothetical protein [Deltaproteobacteria bacterium]